MKKAILLSTVVLILISPSFTSFDKKMNGFDKESISLNTTSSLGGLATNMFRECQKPGPHLGRCTIVEAVVLDQSQIKSKKDDLPDDEVIQVINKYIN